jgi:hypothetical protein
MYSNIKPKFKGAPVETMNIFVSLITVIAALNCVASTKRSIPESLSMSTLLEGSQDHYQQPAIPARCARRKLDFSELEGMEAIFSIPIVWPTIPADQHNPIAPRKRRHPVSRIADRKLVDESGVRRRLTYEGAYSSAEDPSQPLDVEGPIYPLSSTSADSVTRSTTDEPTESN